MIKNYFCLLKLNILNMFKSGKAKGNMRLIGYAILLVFLGYVSYGLASNIFALREIIIAYDALNTTVSLLFFVSSIIIVFFSTASLVNLLFFSNDSDFLMSLPISEKVVFASKFTVAYLVDLVVVIIMILPSLITLGVCANLTILYYIVMVLGVVFMPSLALAIAALLAVPIMYVVSFFKNKGALTSIIVLLLVGGLLGGYYYLIFQLSDIFEGIADLGMLIELFIDTIIAFGNALIPFISLARLANLTTVFGLNVGISLLVNFMLSFGILALVMYVVVLLSGKMYKRALTINQESQSVALKTNVSYEKNSVLKALVLKEWKVLIRNPYAAFQGLIGVILAPIIVVVLYIYVDFGETILTYLMTFFSVLSIGIGANIASVTMTSREGQSGYMIKTMPIDYKTQVKAKLTLTNIIAVVAIVLAVAVTIIFSGFNVNLIFLIAALATFGYAFNCFAIFYDLRKPKFDWINLNEIMKNNFNVAIPMVSLMGIQIVQMFGGIFLFLKLLDLSIAFEVCCMIIWGVYIAIGVVLAVVMHKLLFNNAESLCEKIEL